MTIRLAVDARKLTDFGIGTYLSHLLSGLAWHDEFELTVAFDDLESGWEQIRLYCDTTDKLLADLQAADPRSDRLRQQKYSRNY